jgi:hypothetical protein
MESGYEKDARDETPEAADCTSTLRASRFGKVPYVATKAINTNPI